jgi:uncharacterized protein (DUF1800 family)
MQGSVPTPAQLHAVLNRVAFGANAADRQAIQERGYPAWVEEQLTPDDRTDPEYTRRLAALRMGPEPHYRPEPQKYLNADTATLWPLTQRENLPWPERQRPTNELRAATLLRAVYSHWQLRERVVEFWHTHFSLSVEANEKIAVLLPLWDRDVIRRHALGNFRTLLEATATHPCMLYYQNNASSKASPANENYARELFELHTLGAGAYVNHLYNRWAEVPGARDGQPTGYIDEDVYEAARAFTGWTVADGSADERGGKLPNTGAFHYFEGWHDGYQKRILGNELPPHQPPLADGKQVLDFVANHPATARHVCTRLVRRLLAYEPPAAVVQAAIEAWNQQRTAPDQLRHVVRAIVLHPAFTEAPPAKVKRPLELVASLMRATGAEFAPNLTLTWLLQQQGQPLFQWPTPDGLPEAPTRWTGSHQMLLRWHLASVLLTHNWHKMTTWNALEQTPEPQRAMATAAAQYWAERLLGPDIGARNPKLIERCANLLAQGGSPTQPLALRPEELNTRLKQLVVLLAASPEFQVG